MDPRSLAPTTISPARATVMSRAPVLTGSPTLACDCHGANGVVRLIAGGVEQGQQAIAFEVLDRPPGAIDDRDDLGPVGVQHLDDLARVVALAVWT